jgi:hypothetical protein
MVAVLDPAFRHRFRCDANDRKSRDVLAIRRRNRPLQIHGRQWAEAFAFEAVAIRLGRRGAESDQMYANVTADRGPELFRESGGRSGRQKFEIAALEHDTTIARASGNERTAGLETMRLRRKRRERETQTLERAAGIVDARDEMGEVVERDRARGRRLSRRDTGIRRRHQ